MLLRDSRRDARVDAAGALVTLEEQERSLWDHAQIDEGLALVDSALRMGRIGPYQLQAAIVALHAQAQSPAAARRTGRRSLRFMANWRGFNRARWSS